jgi:putative flippase GtrA
MKRIVHIPLCLMMSPRVCFAHGEQALLLPVGQIGAIVAVVILAFVLKMTIAWRISFLAAALAVGVSSWFVPNLYFVFLDWFGTSGWPWFLLGLLAPIFGALAVYVASRRFAHVVRE